MKHLKTPDGWVLEKDIFGFYEDNGKVYVNYRDPKEPFRNGYNAELTNCTKGIVNKKELEDWLNHPSTLSLTVR